MWNGKVCDFLWRIHLQCVWVSTSRPRNRASMSSITETIPYSIPTVPSPLSVAQSSPFSASDGISKTATRKPSERVRKEAALDLDLWGPQLFNFNPATMTFERLGMKSVVQENEPVQEELLLADMVEGYYYYYSDSLDWDDTQSTSSDEQSVMDSPSYSEYPPTLRPTPPAPTLRPTPLSPTLRPTPLPPTLRPTPLLSPRWSSNKVVQSDGVSSLPFDGTVTVSYDFDGTLHSNPTPDQIGRPRGDLLAQLRADYAYGYKIIITTARLAQPTPGSHGSVAFFSHDFNLFSQLRILMPPIYIGNRRTIRKWNIS